MTIAGRLYGIRHTYLNEIRLPFGHSGPLSTSKGVHIWAYFSSPLNVATFTMMQHCQISNWASNNFHGPKCTSYTDSNAMIFTAMRNHAVTVHPVRVVLDSAKESFTFCQPCHSELHLSRKSVIMIYFQQILVPWLAQCKHGCNLVHEDL